MPRRQAVDPLLLCADDAVLLECAEPPGLLDLERLAERAAMIDDWDRFGEKAVRTRFAPLIFDRLCRSGVEKTLPRALRMRLGASHVSTAAQNGRILADRDRILAALRDAGIDALPLKGCALASPLYGDISLRPMGDIDLLLRECDLSDAAKILSGLEYRVDGIDPRGETFFYREADRSFIDVHTELDPSGRFRIDTGELWRDAMRLPAREEREEADAVRPACRAAGDDGDQSREWIPETGDAAHEGHSDPSHRVEGGRPNAGHNIEWPTLSVRHHFAHALLHAVRHRFESLAPMVDAAWIAARWPEAVEWESLPSLAARWRCREALGFALIAGDYLFRISTPESVRRALAPNRWRERALSRLWPGDSPLRPIEDRTAWERYLFSALTTHFPGGFTGSLRRFRKTRALDP